MKRVWLISALLLISTGARGQWVQTGLSSSQIVQTFAVSGANTSSPRLYTGCYGNGDGIFVTSDNGSTWTDIGLPPPSGFALVYALSVIGANTSSPLLFAGVGAGTNFDSAGVYFSTNEGASWTIVNHGLPDNLTIVSPLASSGMNVFAGTDSGIYLTTNNGASWAAENNGFIASWMGGLIFPPLNALIIAGTSTIFAGTNFGVYRSTNNGTSWQHASVGFPDTNINVEAFAVSGSNLLAGTYAKGVFLSTNNGASWTSANVGPTHIGSATIYFFATSGPDVFATSDSGIFRSSNNGATWISLDTDLNSATYSPVYGVFIPTIIVLDTNLFAGTDVGVWRRPLSDFGISSVASPAAQAGSLAAYPNPFRYSTTIRITAPASGYATVSIVNALGVEVARVFAGELSASAAADFEWQVPAGLPSGMYECVLRMNGQLSRVGMIVE